MANGGTGDPNGVGGGGGYTGLAGVLAALQGGLNSSQYSNLQAGYNGNANYSGGTVGGEHGAFAGLSPWAINYLTTSGILQANAFKPTDTTGLTGQDLFMANLQNALGAQNAAANPTYALSSGGAGMSVQDLQNLLAGGINGHSAYAPGYDASGRLTPNPGTGSTGANPPTNPNGGRNGAPGSALAAVHSKIMADNARLANHPQNQALLHQLAQLHTRQHQLRS